MKGGPLKDGGKLGAGEPMCIVVNSACGIGAGNGLIIITLLANASEGWVASHEKGPAEMMNSRRKGQQAMAASRPFRPGFFPKESGITLGILLKKVC